MNDKKQNEIEDLSFLVANAIINNSTAEETAEYLYKHNYRKQSETITFYKDPNIKDWAESEYAWCKRPWDSNMSMLAIDKKGSIVGYASEHYWTWCDVKEVKEVSAIEFMRHFASKQSETVKEFAEKLIMYFSSQEIIVAAREHYAENDTLHSYFQGSRCTYGDAKHKVNEIAASFGKEE